MICLCPAAEVAAIFQIQSGEEVRRRMCDWISKPSAMVRGARWEGRQGRVVPERQWDLRRSEAWRAGEGEEEELEGVMVVVIVWDCWWWVVVGGVC